MEGTAHILSIQSAPWSGWIMLLLMLCAVMSEWLQPGVVSRASENLLSRADRTYKEAPDNLLAQILINIFRIGTIAMGLCLCFVPQGDFRFAAYAAVCGVLLGMLVVKIICNLLLDYVFQLSRHYGSMYEPYTSLLTLTALVLYPCLLVLLHLDSYIAGRWDMGIVSIVFLMLWLYRSIRQYIHTVLSISYVAFYFITLEILPMAAIFAISSLTIDNICK